MSNLQPPNSLLPILRRIGLALILAFLLLPSTSTSAQTSGSLSGRVTNSNGEPILDVGVALYGSREYSDVRYYTKTNANGEYTFPITDGIGEYTYPDVLPGTYLLRFSSSSFAYRDEFYNNQKDLESANEIVVTAGAVLTGYDAVLPNSGHIVGTVVNADANPMAGVQVTSYRDNGIDDVTEDTTATDSSGVFTIEVRYDNPHYLYFDPNEDYFSEYFNDKHEINEADPLVVAAEETITVAVTLSRTHTISGTVVDGHGVPVANVLVDLYNNQGDWWLDGNTTTDVNGNYRFEHLPPDEYALSYQYRLHFNGNAIVDEYYSDADSFDEAMIIDLAHGPDVFIANAEVTRRGVITGTVTNGDSTPLEGVRVGLYSYSDYSQSWTENWHTFTDKAGNYLIRYQLPDEEHLIRFYSNNVYETEFYPNVYSVEAAQIITIPVETIVQNVNAQLERYGRITGTVTGIGGVPLEGVLVNLYDKNTNAVYMHLYTDVDGRYELSLPPEKEVHIGFSFAGYATQFYDGQSSLTTAAIISAPYNSTVNVDAALHLPVALNAAFSGTPRSGTDPLAVTFTDESLGDITSRSWDFGDSGTSSETNPSHIYDAVGTYTVTLTVTDAATSDVETKVDYITVGDTPITNIGIQQDHPGGNPDTQPKVGETVYFSATAEGSNLQFLWDFGDGALNTASTATGQYVQHAYTTPGNYTVTLTARNSQSEVEMTSEIVVTKYSLRLPRLEH